MSQSVEPYYIFPNIEGTVAAILALGFEQVPPTNRMDFLFTRQFGTRIGYLVIHYETTGWDTSDETYLEFSLDEPKWTNSPWSCLNFCDGFRMGTHNVPTPEHIKEAILHHIDRKASFAKTQMLKAYEDLSVANDALNSVKGITW